MRKIDKEAAQAFVNNTRYIRDNTTVGLEHSRNTIGLYLHGHIIAYKYLYEPNKIYISLRGYNTRTTRNRLNAVLKLVGRGHGFIQRNGEAFFRYNDRDTSGDWDGYIVRINPDKWYMYNQFSDGLTVVEGERLNGR